MTVEPEGTPPVEAVTYVAGEEFTTDAGRPTDDYLDRILTGAREHGLREDYLARIRAQATGVG